MQLLSHFMFLAFAGYTGNQYQHKLCITSQPVGYHTDFWCSTCADRLVFINQSGKELLDGLFLFPSCAGRIGVDS